MREGVNKVALRLFEHNEKAYHAAVRMMEQYGKAAIVHLTSTKKLYCKQNDPWRSSRQGYFVCAEITGSEKLRKT